MRLHGTLRPKVMVTSRAIDNTFIWMSMNWNATDNPHPNADEWVKMITDEVIAAANVTEGVNRIRALGFDVEWNPVQPDVNEYVIHQMEQEGKIINRSGN